MTSTLAIGDRVRLSVAGKAAKIYSQCEEVRTGKIIAFGKGPITQFYPRVAWHTGDEGDLLHSDFIRKIDHDQTNQLLDAQPLVHQEQSNGTAQYPRRRD